MPLYDLTNCSRGWHKKVYQHVLDIGIDAEEVDSFDKACYWQLSEAYRLALEDYSAFLHWVERYPKEGNIHHIVHIGQTSILWFAACWDWIGYYLKKVYDLEIDEGKVYFSTAYEQLSKRKKSIDKETRNKLKKLNNLFERSVALRCYRNIIVHKYDSAYWFVEESSPSSRSCIAEGTQDRKGIYDLLKSLATLLEQSEASLMEALRICQFIAMRQG